MKELLSQLTLITVFMAYALVCQLGNMFVGAWQNKRQFNCGVVSFVPPYKIIVLLD